MKSRHYRQVARAQAAAETRHRIIDAAEALFARMRWEELTLEAVAETARVTRQTVLRLFGSKEGLLSRAAEEKLPRIAAEREAAGDLERALDALTASYERIGRVNWHMLLEEDRSPAMGRLLNQARALHRRWLERQFAVHLARERRRRVELLFAATDFYTFKLYRRDLGMSRAQTRRRMGELVGTLLGSFAKEGT